MFENLGDRLQNAINKILNNNLPLENYLNELFNEDVMIELNNTITTGINYESEILSLFLKYSDTIFTKLTLSSTINNLIIFFLLSL